MTTPVPGYNDCIGLHVGDASSTTDPKLQSETAAPQAPSDEGAVHDDPDPLPTLDPEGDRRRAEAQARERQRIQESAVAEDRYRRTPTFAKVMRWGGLAVGVAGLVAIPATYLQYDSTTTTEVQFKSLQLWNTIGWVGLVAGAGSFGISYMFRPPAAGTTTGASSSVGVGPGGVAWSGSF